MERSILPLFGIVKTGCFYLGSEQDHDIQSFLIYIVLEVLTGAKKKKKKKKKFLVGVIKYSKSRSSHYGAIGSGASWEL